MASNEMQSCGIHELYIISKYNAWHDGKGVDNEI